MKTRRNNPTSLPRPPHDRSCHRNVAAYYDVLPVCWIIQAIRFPTGRNGYGRDQYESAFQCPPNVRKVQANPPQGDYTRYLQSGSSAQATAGIDSPRRTPVQSRDRTATDKPREWRHAGNAPWYNTPCSIGTPSPSGPPPEELGDRQGPKQLFPRLCPVACSEIVTHRTLGPRCWSYKMNCLQDIE
jgi:hypothetical protein